MSALFPNAMETLNPSVWTTNGDRDETKKKKASSIFRMEIFDEKIFYFLFTFFFFSFFWHESFIRHNTMILNIYSYIGLIWIKSRNRRNELSIDFLNSSFHIIKTVFTFTR